MEQPTFADLAYDAKKRQTRREIFLERNRHSCDYWTGRGV